MYENSLDTDQCDVSVRKLFLSVEFLPFNSPARVGFGLESKFSTRPTLLHHSPQTPIQTTHTELIAHW